MCTSVMEKLLGKSQIYFVVRKSKKPSCRTLTLSRNNGYINSSVCLMIGRFCPISLRTLHGGIEDPTCLKQNMSTHKTEIGHSSTYGCKISSIMASYFKIANMHRSFNVNRRKWYGIT